MINEIEKQADKRMVKAFEALQGELTKIRSGRAHPSLLDQVMVNQYGSDTPLSHVASVTVSDPRTLVVQAWDKSLTASIEKAIMQADLGLNPAAAGEVIRVPLPPLTEERRRDLSKVVRQAGENSRVSLRNIRRDANNEFKELLKAKTISEDEQRQGETRIQKMTDQFVKQVDKAIEGKETELMAV